MNSESYVQSSWTPFGARATAQGDRAWWYRWANDLSTTLRHALLWTTPFALLALGWWWRDALPIEAEEGVGYGLGIASAACILILLIYPIRKRIKWLSPIGSPRTWFLVHMSMGVAAPIAALYHCGFSLGSLNSRIALTSILVVSGSGLIGRFLYRKIYSDWSGKRLHLKKSGQLKAATSSDLEFLKLVNERLAKLDQLTQASRHSLAASIRWHLRAGWVIRRERKALMEFCIRQLNRLARAKPMYRRERPRLMRALDAYLGERTLQIRQMARVQVYERLFALWHVAHLPFFILLVISVIVHVFAVHLY